MRIVVFEILISVNFGKFLLHFLRQAGCICSSKHLTKIFFLVFALEKGNIYVSGKWATYVTYRTVFTPTQAIFIYRVAFDRPI